ncbi:t-SNARE [Triangularia setosa]|uniref:t-SNARE n=1 Tax=Triangularia setosa TaxID=2587417 RepID=A0AAN7AA52_9PEZI|nr:t-SNARE [Podospora setosa]
MSYTGYNPNNNPYNQGGGSGYGQGGYGGGGGGGYNRGGNSPSGYSNPFDDRNAANVEMNSLPTSSSPRPTQSSILQKCSEISNDVRSLEALLDKFANLQVKLSGATNQGAIRDEIDTLTTNIMDRFRALKDRVRDVKTDDHQLGGSNRQVGLVERQVQAAIQKFQSLEGENRKRIREQTERQIRIVKGDISDSEMRRMVDSEPAVFSQALMQSNRSGQASSVLAAVRQRHQEMQEVEKRLNELVDLMEEMQELLVKQEAVVMQIDQHAEQAAGDMVKANEELEVAVTTARKTRKKKWICLGICVAIIVIIVVAVVAYVMITRQPAPAQAAPAAAPAPTPTPATEQRRSIFGRNVLDDLHMNNARAVKLAGEPNGQLSRISRRRLNKARDQPVGRRFVVEWDVGSDGS